MHNFEQVKDVLEYARKLHRDLRRHYLSLNNERQEARVRMILDYLSRHETALENALRQFEKSANKQVLETWLQYAPTIEKLTVQKPIEANMSVDDVVKRAVEFDNLLMEFYRAAARETDVPHVREVFENLIAMEHNEKLRFVRDAVSVQHDL